MKALLAVMLVPLGGCLGLGVQNMSGEQIRATEGMATCTDLTTMYGRGRSVTIHADAAKKGLDMTSEVVIGPDCTVTIRGSSAGRLKP